MDNTIDLRSDTVTKPTPEMWEAMQKAKLGDDVLRDDPTVSRLEEVASEIVDKEAALYVPSGTMGNLIALMTHTHPGDEAILDKSSHIFIGEGGGITRVAGIMPRPIPGAGGMMPIEAIQDEIRTRKDLSGHLGETRLICLENTHNAHGGIPITLKYTAQVAKMAHQYGIPVHLDGARLFNAAIALNVNVKELVKPVDSIMFCLSKGLSAPIGSILAGTKEFIWKARGIRQLLGGGMRQAGIPAAAGIIALKIMPQRLIEDHENAQLLAQGLFKLPYFTPEHPVKTNIIYAEFHHPRIDAFKLQAEMEGKGVLFLAFSHKRIRLVTHYGISREDILKSINLFRQACE